MEERGLRGFAGKQGLDQLQIADRHRVQQQALAALVKAEGVNVLQTALLGLLQVVDSAPAATAAASCPARPSPSTESTPACLRSSGRA